MRPRFTWLAVFLLLVVARLDAQSATAAIAAGDRESDAFRSVQALEHYEAAIALDSTSAEAYGKASRTLVDLGEVEANSATRAELFERATRYARRAVDLTPSNADSHFHLARALGRTALSVGVRERIRYAKEVREHALRALELNARHPGAAHVMGMWHAEVMRLNPISRAIARRFLGGQVFSTARWSEAVRLLELAVSIEPRRAVHHLDLARIYRDVDRKDDARREYEAVLAAPRMDVNDPVYKREATEEMRRL